MSAALQYFEENLPHRPYHTDDLASAFASPAKGVRFLRRTSSRTSHMRSSWFFDVDREGAAIDAVTGTPPRQHHR